MITNIRHTGIVVNNLETAIRFYSGLMGFKIVKQADESGEYIDNISLLKGVKVTTVKMAAPDGNLIELLYFSSHKKTAEKRREINDAGFSHIAFTVKNIEEAYKELTGKGILFNAPPQFSPDGYAKVTFCRDPEGNLIELVEVVKK